MTANFRRHIPLKGEKLPKFKKTAAKKSAPAKKKAVTKKKKSGGLLRLIESAERDEMRMLRTGKAPKKKSGQDSCLRGEHGKPGGHCGHGC